VSADYVENPAAAAALPGCKPPPQGSNLLDAMTANAATELELPVAGLAVDEAGLDEALQAVYLRPEAEAGAVGGRSP
jgi:hypothetical protein